MWWEPWVALAGTAGLAALLWALGTRWRRRYWQEEQRRRSWYRDQL